MNVGFIGLGQMGAAMASNLIKAGHAVTVYNRSPEKAEALAAQGARIAGSPAETGDCEAVFTMLANDDALSTVLHGEKGLISGLAIGFSFPLQMLDRTLPRYYHTLGLLT